jgi:signal transduction histidine kinase
MRASRKQASWSKRIVGVFLGSFLLTIGGFMATTFVVRERAENVRAAADAIVSNAAPSITRLSAMRTALRHVEILLDDCVDRATLEHQTCAPMEETKSELESVRSDWRAYRQLPTFPGERDLWPEIDRGLDSFDAALAEIETGLDEHRLNDAQRTFDQSLKPSVDALDVQLARVVQLNSAGGAEALEAIRGEQEATRRESLLLHLLCAVCGLFSAVVAVKLASAHTTLLEDRVDQLELFSGRVAHDLLGPLSSVGIALELAGHRTEGTTRDLIERAKRTVHRMGELVDGLLLLASVGKQNDRSDQAQLDAVLSDVVSEFRPTAQRDGIELELGEVPNASVAASGGVVANIVGNLLSNAIKYMGAASVRRIEVRAIDGGPRVRIEVRDTGPGIPPTMQSAVFDPYIRAAPPGVSGLGLGLATVRRFAQVLGGNAGIESEEGAGTLAWIELPRAPAVRREVQSGRGRATVVRR